MQSNKLNRQQSSLNKRLSLKNTSIPHSNDAEQLVLGAVLNNSENLSLIQRQLGFSSSYFFFAKHQQIYNAFNDLLLKGSVIDLVTVIEELKNQEKYPVKVNSEYIVELLEIEIVGEAILHHAQIIINAAHLRKIISTCEDLKSRCLMQVYEDISQLIDQVEKDLLAIRKDTTEHGLVGGSEVLNRTVEAIVQRSEIEGIPGISSGFTDLDAVTGGFQNSDLVILAARPGMGKTAMVLNWAVSALRQDKKVAIFSLEMSKEQLMERIIVSEGKIDSTKMRKGDVKAPEEEQKLTSALKIIREYSDNLFVDDTPSINLAHLISNCRNRYLQHKLDMVIIDYLQLMVGSKDIRSQGREREVSEISMGLKALAKELAIPVVAAAQLNRSPDSRTNKRPRISDLRESGSMEQDADQIMFIYRDEYYNPNSQHAGQAEVIIGKNRHGPLTKINLAYFPNYLCFKNLHLVKNYYDLKTIDKIKTNTNTNQSLDNIIADFDQDQNDHQRLSNTHMVNDKVSKDKSLSSNKQKKGIPDDAEGLDLQLSEGFFEKNIDDIDHNDSDRPRV